MTPTQQCALLLLLSGILTLIALTVLRVVTFRMQAARSTLRRNLKVLCELERDEALIEAKLATDENTLREIERVRDEAQRLHREAMPPRSRDAQYDWAATLDLPLWDRFKS